MIQLEYELCQRCKKQIVDLEYHTCTPRGAWRKGMDEGIDMAIRYILKAGEHELFSIHHFSKDVAAALEELKQGKSDE